MRSRHSFFYILIGGAVVFSLLVIGNTHLCAQAGDPAGTIGEQVHSYIFVLELDGKKVADFTECSGLGSSNDIEETLVVDASGRPVIQKTAGALRWADIALRRQGPNDDTVWTWRKAVEGESVLEPAIQDGTILMVDVSTSQPVARWKFHQGWAASLTLDGAVEELVIVHQGLERMRLEEGNGPPRGRH